ncbi:SDR family NAD(P)-dependent oxidoreductase [Microlunatus parietis]|uniref:3-oxoacyl-[acyl-carrier protein] reductase n=1 Tax=Microlunatus parietis TaxID=682979 RepID=A0A7Y9I2Y8_9ACTN|nr:3-oxoacyl-ACP reductase FabG [Microlunatus parietis]NYE69279.1 3-oxoacyl-[acyl-carrier protein] reductase [Microlunatus parietis]
MTDLSDTRALVTGAGHGIGRGIALGLAAAGADVAVHYGSSADAAAETVSMIEKLGRKATAVQADVTSAEQVDRMVAEAVSFLGGLDVLVCNAGHLIGRVPVAEMAEEHYQRVVDVNLGATFRTCKAAIEALRESDRPRIITMSSLAAHNGGGPGSVIYAAAKAGIRGFTKGLAKELGPDKITVNAVAPGYIADTAFHNTFSTAEAQQTMIRNAPIGRSGQVEDVAAAVVFLASAEAGYLTGSTLDIDGGTWPR